MFPELPSEPAPLPKTRGIVWVLGPAALGLILGCFVGAAYHARSFGTALDSYQVPIGVALGLGGLPGLILGGFVGTVIWAFFPYVRKDGQAGSSSEMLLVDEEELPPAREGHCPACGAAVQRDQARCPACQIVLR